MEKIVPTKRYIAKYSRICSKHFEDSCYEYIGKRRILKQNAIPRIFDLENVSTINLEFIYFFNYAQVMNL